MNKLIIPDAYESTYSAMQQMDPSFQYTHIPVRRDKVEAIDKLLEEVGPRELIQTEEDYGALEKVFKFYTTFWPEDAVSFKKAIPDIRSSRNEGGYSQSKETKFVGAIPPILMRLIKIAFPMQQWDKNFSNTFVKRYKTFNVGGMI